MKKTVAFKAAIAVCTITFAALSLTACGTKSFNLENITRIELTDGATGNIVEIIEQDTIQHLIQPFNDNEFKKGESAKNQAGWSYRLSFYQEDKLTTTIVVHGQDGSRISVNDSFYDMNDGVINADIYKNLLSTDSHSPNLLSSWTPISELPQNYSPEEAIADGAYVDGWKDNQALVDNFYMDVSNGIAAFMRVVMYTAHDGNAIIMDYQYDGNIFTITTDTSRSATYGAEGRGIYTTVYKYLVPDERSRSRSAFPMPYFLSNERNIYRNDNSGEVALIHGLAVIPSPSYYVALMDDIFNEVVESTLREYANAAGYPGEFLAMAYRIIGLDESDYRATVYVFVEWGWFTGTEQKSGAGDLVAILYDKEDGSYVNGIPTFYDAKQIPSTQELPQYVIDGYADNTIINEVHAEYTGIVKGYIENGLD